MIVDPAGPYLDAHRSLVTELGPVLVDRGLACCTYGAKLERRAAGLDHVAAFADGSPWWQDANVWDGGSPFSSVGAARATRPGLAGTTDLPLETARADGMTALLALLDGSRVVAVEAWHAFRVVDDAYVVDLSKGGHYYFLLVEPDGRVLILDSSPIELAPTHHGVRMGGVVGAVDPTDPRLRREDPAQRLRQHALVGMARLA